MDERPLNLTSVAVQAEYSSTPASARLFWLLGPPAIGTFVIIASASSGGPVGAIFALVLAIGASFQAAAATVIAGSVGLILAAVSKRSALWGWVGGSVLGYLASSQLFKTAREVPWFPFTFPVVYFLIALPVWAVFESRRIAERPEGQTK